MVVAEKAYRRTHGVHRLCPRKVIAIWKCPGGGRVGISSNTWCASAVSEESGRDLFCPSNAEVSWSLPSMCPGIAEQTFRRTPGVRGSRERVRRSRPDLGGSRSVLGLDQDLGSDFLSFYFILIKLINFN